MPVGPRDANQSLRRKILGRGQEERLAARRDPIADVRLSVPLEAIDPLEGPGVEEPLRDLERDLVAALVVDPRQGELDQTLPVFG
jgi:hypothetical protein